MEVALPGFMQDARWRIQDDPVSPMNRGMMGGGLQNPEQLTYEQPKLDPYYQDQQQ